MEGDAIDSWKADQLDKLNERVDDGYLETEEIHWRKFESAFKDAFTNTNEKAEAYQELTRLKQGDNLDTFITEFKRLVGIAKIDKDSHGVIELFKGGLKSGLTRAIISSQGFNPLNPWPTLDEWIKAAQAQHIKWKMALQFSQQKDQKHQALYKVLGIRKPPNGGGRHTTSQGGDAMDVNAVRTNSLTDNQRDALMKANKCFYCQKPGHRAKDCYKKKRDQGNLPPAQVNAAEETPRLTKDSRLTSKQLAELIKENVDELDVDFKLGLVEDILPQDFLQARN